MKIGFLSLLLNFICQILVAAETARIPLPVQANLAETMDRVPQLHGRGISPCQQANRMCSKVLGDLIDEDHSSALLGFVDSAKKQCSNIKMK